VFAKHDLNVGDIITMYPADLTVEMIDEKTLDCNIAISDRLFQLKFGDNVEFTEENLNSQCSDFFYDYLIKITDTINISGHPHFNDNTAYLGHLINDATEIIPTNENEIEAPIHTFQE
jgi:hypothetical protein